MPRAFDNMGSTLLPPPPPYALTRDIHTHRLPDRPFLLSRNRRSFLLPFFLGFPDLFCFPSFPPMPTTQRALAAALARLLALDALETLELIAEQK